MSTPLKVFSNTAEQSKDKAVTLSVLIPFYRDDPTALLTALDQDAPDGVEFLTFDDGRPDLNLNSRVKGCIEQMQSPTCLLVCETNQGRSAARNELANHAKGAWILFLDADMKIDPGFLGRWVESIEHSNADGLFGGYQPPDSVSKPLQLHAELARQSDVKTAEERRTDTPYSVCSSNLAVKRAAFESCPFDTGFKGWGWEDTSWALSFAAQHTIDHIDNPARHEGLEPVDRLIAKFSESGPNFARLVTQHPEYRTRSGAKLAYALRSTGMATPARILGKWIAKQGLVPIRLRVLALKLFRAGLSARYLP